MGDFEISVSLLPFARLEFLDFRFRKSGVLWRVQRPPDSGQNFELV